MAEETSTETTTEETKEETKVETKPDGDEKLGEGGKKALDDERKARRTAEKELRDAQKRLKELEDANASEQDKAVAAAKEEGRNETLKVANERLLRAEVKGLAAGKLADPNDAVRLLDLDDFEIDKDGNVDSKAITSAIEELVKEKPYLSAKGGKAAPLPGGGASSSTEGPNMDDWLREQVAKQGR